MNRSTKILEEHQFDILDGICESTSIRGYSTEPIDNSSCSSNIYGRRNAPRYNLNYSVIISNSHSKFRTKTINISLSGVLIEENLGIEFNNQLVDVILIYDLDKIKKFLLFKAKVVSEKCNPSPRLKFISSALNSYNILQSILSE